MYAKGLSTMCPTPDRKWERKEDILTPLTLSTGHSVVNFLLIWDTEEESLLNYLWKCEKIGQCDF